MKQYEMFEFTYSAPAPCGSCVEVDLTAEFCCNGQTVSVKGFYAGNGTYKVRFLPMQAGSCTYVVKGVVADTGEMVILPADRHGPIHAEGFHFRHADGTRYSPFGTTVYALAHQDAQTTRDTFESLKDAPFNKVRLCLFPKHYQYNHNDPEYYPFEKNADGSWDVQRPCFVFWDAFEEKLQQLDALDIQADLILFHPYDHWGFSKLGQKNNLIYLDYLLRRFSAFPHIWWSLANEYDLLNMTVRDWEEIEGFVAVHDPFGHPVSNHNCFAFWDAARPNIAHASLQTKQLTRIAEWRELYQKPVVIDECCYEGNLPEFWGSISGREMVRRFWRVVTTGGYCTHGETFLDPKHEVIWWAKGGKLKGESAPRIRFLRDIVASLPGPIDPVSQGFQRIRKVLLASDPEALLAGRDPAQIGFIKSILRMGQKEISAYLAAEFLYAGCCGEDAFLNFYDLRCCAKDVLELPEGKKYRVELIDVWDMTHETIAEHVSGKVEICLPGKEDMAVLALAERTVS